MIKSFKCASFEAPQAGEKTLSEFVLDELPGLRQIIERGLSFHPEIATKVWRTRTSFDAGLTRQAGQFSTLDGIKLHPGLKVAKISDFIETLLHELAHAMQFYAYGEISHGASWWEMMHQLGQKPIRTHNIETCFGKVQPKTLGLNAEDLGL